MAPFPESDEIFVKIFVQVTLKSRYLGCHGNANTTDSSSSSSFFASWERSQLLHFQNHDFLVDSALVRRTDVKSTNFGSPCRYTWVQRVWTLWLQKWPSMWRLTCSTSTSCVSQNAHTCGQNALIMCNKSRTSILHYYSIIAIVRLTLTSAKVYTSKLKY